MLRVLGVLAFLTATAAAEDTSVELRIENGRIEASVIGTERLASVELRDGETSVEPMIVRPFNVGKPLALMLVIEANELAMGTVERQGMLGPLQEAIDRAQLRSFLPAESLVAAVMYADRAQLTIAWKPVEEFTGADLGSGNHYEGRTGNNLYDALDLAIEVLAVRPEPHKLMIVIGDGTTPVGNRADGAMRELRERAKGIDIVALVIPHEGSSDEISIDDLTERARQGSIEQLGVDFKDAFDVATKRFQATFDIARFKHDGQEHTFRLMHGGNELGSARLTMPGTPAPSKTWRYLVVLGVLVAFGGVSLVMFRSKAL